MAETDRSGSADPAPVAADPEKQQQQQQASPSCAACDGPGPQSAFKKLGLLDRFLAVWILLAMAIGIILGNFVPEMQRALDRGKLVGVSVPIGGWNPSFMTAMIADGIFPSDRPFGHDVSNSLQGAV